MGDWLKTKSLFSRASPPGFPRAGLRAPGWQGAARGGATPRVRPATTETLNVLHLPAKTPGVPIFRAEALENSNVGELIAQYVVCFSFQLRLGRECYRRVSGQTGPKSDTSPPHPRSPPSAFSLKGRSPALSPSLLFSLALGFPTPYRLHLATLSVSYRLVVKEVRDGAEEGDETRGNARPGGPHHYPIPRRSTRRPIAHPGA